MILIPAIRGEKNKFNNPFKEIFTETSTTLVRARTRSVLKEVKRFLWVGRVVRKKLTRATQERLEAVKESKQRGNFTAEAIPHVICFNPSIWSWVLL